jgi:hypothetical protein
MAEPGVQAEGVCARAHVRCGGCGRPAPIAVRYGGPMADCRVCCFAWAVRHDPERCWVDDLVGEETEADLAARVHELTPLLVATRALLTGGGGGWW